MAQEKRERVEVIRGDGIERRQRVVETSPSGRRVFVSRFSQFRHLARDLRPAGVEKLQHRLTG